MKKTKFLAAVITLAVVAAGSVIQNADAALIPGGATGPIAPDGGLIAGFPRWYMDQNGLALDLMEAADPFGISDPVNPANPFSQQIGFNAEGFWWSAEASIDDGAGHTGLLVLAMEAAFAGEAAVDGEQSSFGRIRYRITGLVPGETYTVNHPFGTANEVADGAGVINVTNDIGCLATDGVTTCDPAKVGTGVPPLASAGGFDVALSSGIGPFLTWNTFNANPALQDPVLVNPANPGRMYVGNPNVAHAVTGGTNGNSFSVSGLGLSNFTTSLFAVTGRLADTTPPVITLTGANPDTTVQNSVYVDPGATALDDFDGAIPASATAGVPVDTTTLGAKTITYTATDNAGNTATATRTVNVEAPVLTSINVTPVNPNLAVGQNQQFSAEALDQGGNPLTPQPAFTWTSGTPATGTIDTAGNFTAIAEGSSLITATSGLVSGTSTAVVGPLALTTINVTPANPAITAGNTRQMNAATLDQLGNPFAGTVAWTSGNPSVGTIDPTTGFFTAVSAGTTTVTATSGAVSGQTVITVNPLLVLTTINLSAPNANMKVGDNQQLAVAKLDQFGNPIAAVVVFSSSDNSIAIVDANGIASAMGTGTATITASSGAVSSSVQITVSPLVVPQTDLSIEALGIVSVTKNSITLSVKTSTDSNAEVIISTKKKSVQKNKKNIPHVSSGETDDEHTIVFSGLKRNKNHFWKLVVQKPDGSQKVETGIFRTKTLKR